MKIAITGHTSGIGKALYLHYSNAGHELIGFSKSSGYDIANSEVRERICYLADECDMFVNNAYNNFDDSQLEMLKLMANSWQNSDKLIVNISSRWTKDKHQYCLTKLAQDQFIESLMYNKLHVVNLKPGWIDTPRVNFYAGNKMPVDNVCQVMDFILSVRGIFKVQSMTFSSY